jgi:hypothetical protein
MTKPKMKDVDILARTLYGEAEGGNLNDANAIACVVLNRIGRAHWPDSAAAVCLQPWQFSCWNMNDPNRARILEAHGAWFDTCQTIALKALSGEIPDMTGGSTHYYATYCPKPKWANKKTPVFSVMHKNGHSHVFFNDVDTKPPVTPREALEQIKPLSKSKSVTGAQVAIGTGSVIGAAAEVMDQVAPAMPLAQTLAQYAPWAIVAVLALGLGYMVWRRIDDRNKGFR